MGTQSVLSGGCWPVRFNVSAVKFPVLNHGRLCPIFSSTVLQRISRNKNKRSTRRLSNVKLLRMVMPRRCHSYQMHLSSLVRVTGRMSPRPPLVVSSSLKRLTSGTPSQLLNKATGPSLVVMPVGINPPKTGPHKSFSKDTFPCPDPAGSNSMSNGFQHCTTLYKHFTFC